jgi:aryl-alcohol dehydrogenase-like predicted oxidoreductase
MIQLDQRQLGKSDIVAPSLGIGVWQASENIGAIGWRLSEEEMKQIENAA